MKMIKALVVLALCSSALLSAPRYTDVYSAAKMARETGKVVYFVVMSEDCPHCQKYWQTLNDPEIENLLNNEVVLAVTNLNSNDKVPKDLPFNGRVPTTYLMRGDGNLINQPLVGPVPRNSVKDLLVRLGRVQRWD